MAIPQDKLLDGRDTIPSYGNPWPLWREERVGRITNGDSRRTSSWMDGI